MLRLAEGRPHSTSTQHGSRGQQGSQGQEGQECEEEVRLCLLLPHFEHFFAQLVQADAAYALQCLDQYIRHLRCACVCVSMCMFLGVCTYVHSY